MKQLHIVHDISVRSGGLGLAALRYAQAVAKAGASVTLFVAKRTVEELDFEDNGTQFAVVGPTLHSGGGGLAALWEQLKAVRRCLIENQFDIVHLHGTWSPILAIAADISRARSIPFIVSPHGCLEPWALGHRKLKKQVALAVYQRRILKNASMLVATAGQELESIRGLGLTSPVALLPNGVDLVAEPRRCAGSIRKLLFLSRIHPQKGLSDLVQAWARVRQPGWQVVIAGPSERGYEDEIQLLIRKQGFEGDFDFPGLVSGEKKECCFAEADIFVLPTYSENFGIAVAEALARGIPVITTTGAPWQELETHRCGWWVTPGVDGVAAGLSAAMAMSRDSLADMGARGKKLVEEKYSWDRIGRDALRASEWMLRPLGAHPECINLARSE
jgi:glycosyltransferase involved in cell wall biosynthesis